MDKSKLRPGMKFLKKTGFIYQISLEDFHGKFMLFSSPFPFTHMGEFGENRYYEYLTFAHILVKTWWFPMVGTKS